MSTYYQCPCCYGDGFLIDDKTSYVCSHCMGIGSLTVETIPHDFDKHRLEPEPWKKK
jgi:DnaJ-class molecular chaperone